MNFRVIIPTASIITFDTLRGNEKLFLFVAMPEASFECEKQSSKEQQK